MKQYIEKALSTVGFSIQRHNIKIEVMAGLTTFMTMAYILALNPVIYAPLAHQGFPVGSLFTATALASIIGTLLMAFVAKRPIAQAPGLTLNIFFVETICISLGYTWQFALTAVFVEGLLFIIICYSNIRRFIFEMMPTSLKHAIAVGIGLFVADIGLRNGGLIAEGTIFNHIDTLTQPSVILFLIGLLSTGVFYILHIRGGLIFSIIITTLIGIPMGVTKAPESILSMPASPEPLCFQFSFIEMLTPDFWVCVLTMLFFDVFDSLGTIVGLMTNARLIRKDGRIPNMRNIMLSDAIATSAGACLGCSTVTTYVESAVGVAEGGRTGLTAIVVALGFTASLFFAPLFMAIPSAATAPIMVMAGFYLFTSIQNINFKNPVESIPAFLSILLMPVTGSISDGIIGGLFAYVVLSLIDGLIHPNKHRYPADDDPSDYNDKIHDYDKRDIQ